MRKKAGANELRKTRYPHLQQIIQDSTEIYDLDSPEDRLSLFNLIIKQLIGEKK